MAYLIVRRLWHDELIPVMEARMKKATVQKMMKDIAPLEDINGHDSEHGDVWIEGLDHHHDLWIDPVAFKIETARRVVALMSDGRPTQEWMSDAYVEHEYQVLKANGLAHYEQMMARRQAVT